MSLYIKTYIHVGNFHPSFVTKTKHNMHYNKMLCRLSAWGTPEDESDVYQHLLNYYSHILMEVKKSNFIGLSVGT